MPHIIDSIAITLLPFGAGLFIAIFLAGKLLELLSR